MSSATPQDSVHLGMAQFGVSGKERLRGVPGRRSDPRGDQLECRVGGIERFKNDVLAARVNDGPEVEPFLQFGSDA